MCNDPLTELSNPGASGSIFYITDDEEFIIKTLQHKEAEFLQKLLPGYYMVSTITRGCSVSHCIGFISVLRPFYMDVRVFVKCGYSRDHEPQSRDHFSCSAYGQVTMYVVLIHQELLNFYIMCLYLRLRCNIKLCNTIIVINLCDN